MDIKTVEINNHINLLCIPSTKFKTISTVMLIRNHLARETATKNAIIPPLLKRGCNKYPSLSEINTKTEELYGAVFDAVVIKKGEEQIMQFYMETLSRSFDENLLFDGLEMLRDIVLEPLTENGGFVKEFTEGEKENLRRTIKSRLNDKKEYAKLRCVEEMCKDEPFGIYGDGYYEDVDEINSQNLYEHYKHILLQSPIDFIIIGDCDIQKTAEKLKKLFSIKRDDISPIPKTKVVYKPSEQKVIKDKYDTSQAKLCMGMRSDSPNTGKAFYALLVLNEVFGGGPESKLFKTVREKESLCYYVNSFVYRFKSIIMVQSGINEKDAEKAIDLIKSILDEIKQGEITVEEIEKSKKNLVKRLTGVYDSPQGIMDFYLTQKMLDENCGIDDAIRFISEVEQKEVLEAAKGLYVDTVYLGLP